MKPVKRRTTHISIVGSCVCRDIFEIVKKCDGFCADTENEYIVDKYIQSIAFVSAVSPKVDSEVGKRLIEESQASAKQNFFKKMFRLDVEKSWYEYVAEVKSEWLLIDMTPARFKLCKIGDTYLSYDLAVAIAAKCKNKSDDTEMGRIFQYEVVDPSKMEKEELRRAYHRWIELLLRLYPQNRIIVVKAKNTRTYVDDACGKVLSPDSFVDHNSERENALFDFAYECVLEKLPRAYVVNELALLVGNSRHKWGKFGLHYVDDTYLYLYRCIDYIIHARKGRAEIEKYMMEQNLFFSEKVFRKYVSTVNACVQNERNVLHMERGVKAGVYDKNGLKLTVLANNEFSLCGTSSAETVFYLMSGSGNPCGGWNSVKDELLPGKYLFTTRVECKLDDYFIQLVLTDEGGEKRWVYGNLSNAFTLEHAYAYRLVRVVVKAGKTVDIHGRMALEGIDLYETQNTV